MYGDASTPANQYGSQAAEAWARGNTGSSSVYVGVIDEGIQFTHPDLDANVWTNPFDPANGRDDDGNGYVDDVRGWDFANGDNSDLRRRQPRPLDDHGTHVAGTIGGEGNNGAGVAGVNWSTTLISGKFLGPQRRHARRRGQGGRLLHRPQDAARPEPRRDQQQLGRRRLLAEPARRDQRARTPRTSCSSPRPATAARTTTRPPSYPSGYDVANVIAVAAIDKTGGLASFSQYGATTVDLGAPGVDIWSTHGVQLATPPTTAPRWRRRT